MLKLAQGRERADAHFTGILHGDASVFRLEPMQADEPGRAEHAGFHHQHQRGAAGDRPDCRLLRIEHRQRFLQRGRLDHFEGDH